MDKTIFNFLIDNGEKTLTGNEWSNLLNVRVIDADGWDGGTTFHLTPISLSEFMTRVRRSTIM